MRDFFEWSSKRRGKSLPWLILGKGPSYSQFKPCYRDQYNLLSLNHVVREQKVTLAHIIDFDVLEHCSEQIIRNAEFLVMPWYPHIKYLPRNITLQDKCSENPVLKQLDTEGRLLWYNLSSSDKKRGDSPVVEASYFSAEAAINLLAMSGVKKIRSLGVDGGRSYSSAFKDLSDKTLLANGNSSFDVQFKKIAEIIFKAGVDYSHLSLESPIRVYVGSTERQMLPVRVLEYSIRKNTSMSVEVIPLFESDIQIPLPKAESNRPRTPFSFQRFLIPQLAGYKGKAIYLDSDMQVFEDLTRLWMMPFNGADLLSARSRNDLDRAPQYSVMLLDCNRLRWEINGIVARLDSGDLSYEELMYQMSVARIKRADIPYEWNSLEEFEENKTNLIHYTDMPVQPWVSIENPNGHIWTAELIRAVREGFISRSFVENEVAKKYVRPSLLYQIDNGICLNSRIPEAALSSDGKFRPPVLKKLKQ